MSTALGLPSRNFAAITPSDSVNISQGETAYLYVGTAGNITCMVQVAGVSTALLFTGLAAGWHPIRTTRINATGTTASTIIGAF